ncbi:MAG: glycine/sarcosine/betaine reductase selenoprotein B family protein [Candidatus Binataceae bacterium]|jgi:D-proline reductase (dithiol) PrdB
MSYRIDPYKFLPRSMVPEFREFPHQPGAPPPVRPCKSLGQARVALLTSAGLYVKRQQAPFDLERERNQPTWGDPSYRMISRRVKQEEIGVAHLHINPDDILNDLNIALPTEVLEEFARRGVIGAVAEHHYSFMGYQGNSLEAWRTRYGVELGKRLREEQIDLLLLAPS